MWKIKPFGYLLVFNTKGECIAVSENSGKLFDEIPKNLLKKDLIYSENLIDTKINIDILTLENNHLNNKIDYYQININNIDYQISVYLDSDKIFLEFEENEKVDLDIFTFEEIKSEIDNSENIWQSLADKIYQIINFDRIMIYQFLEDGTGIVLAESIKGNLPSVLGYRYPEFDIPKQARKLFTTNLDRQTPDIFGETIQIIGLKPSEINLSKSK